MIALLCFVLAILAAPFKSKSRLEAENAALRHQLSCCGARCTAAFGSRADDRWFFIQLYRWFPSILKVLTIIRPDTPVRWHRVLSLLLALEIASPWEGRPQIETDLAH